MTLRCYVQLRSGKSCETNTFMPARRAILDAEPPLAIQAQFLQKNIMVNRDRWITHIIYQLKINYIIIMIIKMTRLIKISVFRRRKKKQKRIGRHPDKQSPRVSGRNQYGVENLGKKPLLAIIEQPFTKSGLTLTLNIVTQKSELGRVSSIHMTMSNKIL